MREWTALVVVVEGLRDGAAVDCHRVVGAADALPGVRRDMFQHRYGRSDVASLDQELFGARREKRHHEIADRKIVDLAARVEADRDAG